MRLKRESYERVRFPVMRKTQHFFGKHAVIIGLVRLLFVNISKEFFT